MNFSTESFLYECFVLSLLFEADKITKADTQNKSVADAVAIDQSNERENVVDVLRMRLNDYNQEMEETAGGGNCFFRAVSRMVYGSDEFYLNLRSQALEYLRNRRQEFDGFIANGYTSIDNYITLL